MTQADTEPTAEIAPFDVAFGITPYLRRFADALTSADGRTTHIYSDFPEFMTTRSGHPLDINQPEVFRAEFDFMMEQFVGAVPDGRIRFNLGGMTADFPASVTTWELRHIVRSPTLLSLTEFYDYTGNALEIVTDDALWAKIGSIIELE